MLLPMGQVVANRICNLVLKVEHLPPRDARMLANGSERMPTESLKDAVGLCRSTSNTQAKTNPNTGNSLSKDAHDRRRSTSF
jgi:hypothetical protein